MKTSNKILLGLLFVIFTAPFLLATSLKSKMKKGEYTMVKHENATRNVTTRLGSFRAFEVIKIVAPRPEVLTCHLTQSDKMTYSYEKDDSEDSVTIFNSNDTLYIKYVNRDGINDRNRGRRGHFVVNVYLPTFDKLVVDGAIVNIHSLPNAPDNFSVTLKNRGEIKKAGRDAGNGKAPTGRVTKEISMKAGKPVHVSKAHKVERLELTAKEKMDTFQNAGVEILDLNIKDLLFYRLLSRS